MKTQWTEEEIALHDKYRPLRELCRPAECKGGGATRCWVAHGIRGMRSISGTWRCASCNVSVDRLTENSPDPIIAALRAEISLSR